LQPAQAAQRHEVVEIQLKAARNQIDSFANVFKVSIFPVGRQTHNFAFVDVLLVADEFANHGVEAAKGVRQEDTV